MQTSSRYESLQRFLPEILFSVATLLAYPLLLVFGESLGVKLFTMPTLTALALAFVLWRPERLASALAGSGLFPALPLATLSGIAAWHFALDQRWDFEALCLSLSWVAIPLFAWTSHEQWRRSVPWLLSVMWTGTVALSLLDMNLGRNLCGIPGNWNWNAALIVMTLPFTMHMLLKAASCVRRVSARILLWLLAAAALALSAWLVYLCDSRAVYIALAGTGVLLAAVESPAKWRKWTFSALASLFLLAVIVLAIDSRPVAKALSCDVRGPLWSTAMELVARNPVVGVGEASFESRFASIRPPEYFMRPNAAVRTNHPHNNLIFIACGFGILGLLAWLCLLVYPACLFIISAKKRSVESKLVFYALTAMLIHSQFDLVLYEWPTSVCALLLLGLLWADTWPPGAMRPFPRLAALKLAGRLAAVLIAAAACLSAFLCLWSHCLFAKYAATRQNAGDAAAPISAYFLHKASEISKNDPQIIYRGATSAYLSARSPELCIIQLDMLDQTPWWNFAHAHGFRAKSLQLRGRYAEAIEAIQKETASFPTQIIPLQTLATLYSQRGDKANFERTLAALDAVMKMRGIDAEGLREIQRNPDLDLRFRYVKPQAPGKQQ